jgi:hypothetical protein
MTAAASTVHCKFAIVNCYNQIKGLFNLTAIEINCNSVSFLARHRVTAYTSRNDLGCSDAITAILAMGSFVLN